MAYILIGLLQTHFVTKKQQCGSATPSLFASPLSSDNVGAVKGVTKSLQADSVVLHWNFADTWA